ncbi:hypothetical protein [Aurantibacillus circumpalustris]|uniref:hypothetical protein n=1 Tax=Aurantibacillus circumpalustris TaxID=3036359 RepID=UPI00295ACEA2|nr:hypothetical protein [Aurantibacillus circumpalustris]
MNNKLQNLLLTLSLLASCNFFGQRLYRIGGDVVRIQVQKKVELLAADPASLKKLHNVGIKYNFDSVFVCSFLNQEDYFKDLRENFSTNKAEKMISEWLALPKTTLEPRFELFFNKNINKIGIHGSNTITREQDAILVVKILEEDPHLHRDDGYSMPHIITNCTFFDKEEKLIASFLITATGSRENNMSKRRAECYAIAGKMLAREVIKRLK